MSLFIVQHGKSLPKDTDPDPGLSEEGISDVTRIAEVAKGYKVSVSIINHSPKKRARQTAEIFNSFLQPESGIREIGGLKPLDDVIDMAGSINSNDNVMLVGHLPFMEKLTAYLITGSTDQPLFKFQNGGILSLDEDRNTGAWVIKWALMPNIE